MMLWLPAFALMVALQPGGRLARLPPRAHSRTRAGPWASAAAHHAATCRMRQESPLTLELAVAQQPRAAASDALSSKGLSARHDAAPASRARKPGRGASGAPPLFASP